MELPHNFGQLVYLFDKQFDFKNILLVRSRDTGHFMDGLFPDRIVTRVIYDIDIYDEYLKTIQSLDKKFDLICLDPFHTYYESSTDFKELIPLLSDTGILVSHDCYQKDFCYTSPIYTDGAWSGVTYAAFIEAAYNNPDLYYTVLNRDCGLGIISKTQIQYVRKILNNEHQKIFLDFFHAKRYAEAFVYYQKNLVEISNFTY